MEINTEYQYWRLQKENHSKKREFEQKCMSIECRGKTERKKFKREKFDMNVVLENFQ